MNDVYIPRGGRKKLRREDIVSVERIFCVVEEFFGIDRQAMMQRSKKVEILYPRQVCQYLLFKHSTHNAKGIGVLFDQHDNSSCMNSVKSIENYMDTDVQVKEQIESLTSKLIQP